MIGRALILSGGVLVGAAGSQFPEFSQQYVQRLGGAVDALGEVVADFDASAASVGLTREAALEQMGGTEFLDRRRTDMTRTIARYEALRMNLAAVAGAGPFMRAYHASALSDAEVARATWSAYSPAVPLTMPGAVFGGTGFLAGMLAAWALIKAVLWPIRRRRAEVSKEPGPD
ncbi:MAG: DUF2937 family protein [Pseudomonadota bacterium]